jgi:hypothetical protein
MSACGTRMHAISWICSNLLLVLRHHKCYIWI